MKTGVKVFLLVLAGLLTLTVMMSLCSKGADGEAECTHSDTAFRCVEYLRNYDGDTIAFNIPNVHPLLGKDINVRLMHVDAPEIKTINICERKVAVEAKLAIEQLLTESKRIDLEDVKRDKYFRIDANVIVDGKSLSKVLLEKSLAYPYEGGKKPTIDWCNFSIDGRGP